MHRLFLRARSVVVIAAAGLLFEVARAGAPALAEATPESVGFSAERLAQLDRYMQDLVASGHIPGATTLLARHGKIVAFNAYGLADPDRGVRMNEEAIFRIYSQTKVVTGVAMMILFEEGRWRFDDPITRFVPEFEQLRVFKQLKPDGSMELEAMQRPPTMRELLTHSAGFAYGLDNSTPVQRVYAESQFMRAASTDDAIRRITKLPLASQPGVHWYYSAAVDIQGYIVERISGQKLADFMRSRIFEPLRMNDTGFHVPSEKMSRLVALKAYDEKSGKLVEPSGPLMFDYSKPPGVASGGAGLVSTTRDYARFAQMLLNGGELDGARILSPAATKLLASNHLADEIRVKPEEPFSARTGWGFGVDVAVVLDAAKAGTLRGEGSFDWSGAAGTWFWVDPRNDLIFIGMIQVMNRWQHPQLKNIDSQTTALVYRALVEPQR